MRAPPAGSGCCASRTSTCRARSAARTPRSSPRSSATGSHGTARSCASRGARAVYAAALARLLRGRRMCTSARARAASSETAPLASRRRARLSGHVPRRHSRGSAGRTQRAFRVRVGDARIDVPRPAPGRADAGPRTRRRRFRRPPRRRALRLPACGRRRRRAAGNHPRRARRGSARIDAEADPAAALARLSGAVVPARTGRDQRARPRSSRSRRARRPFPTTRCRRFSPRGVSSTRRFPTDPRRAAHPSPSSGRGRFTRGIPLGFRRCAMLPAPSARSRARRVGKV